MDSSPFTVPLAPNNSPLPALREMYEESVAWSELSCLWSVYAWSIRNFISSCIICMGLFL